MTTTALRGALDSWSLRASSSRRAAARVRSRTPTRAPGRRVAVMSSSLKSSGGEDARSVPILFLDIDGVLNRTATAPQINLEQDKVDRLKGVLGTSGADIVLTTYWRCFESYIGYVLGRMGAQGDRVVGRTPGEPHLMNSVKHDDNVKYARIVEIETYLTNRFGEDRSGWPKFAVVDDKQVVPAGHEWSDRFVKTEPEVGLTDERAGALATALDIEHAEVVAA